MCDCYDCLRRRGITRHVRDRLGRWHDRADGRYLTRKAKDPEGKSVIVRDERMAVPSVRRARKYAGPALTLLARGV